MNRRVLTLLNALCPLQKYGLVIVVLAIGISTAEAQKSKSQKAKTPKAAEKQNTVQHEEKVRDMVNFFQFVLNTLGSSQTAARDKEILITESYTKIFRDAKVQVEDDLDAARKVITNKDVVAYLKDVDFFFRDVKFELVIEAIESSTLSDGTLFYKVSLTRNMAGTTADGKTVNNTIPRYIEINFNPEHQDLKIVSIYTNEFNEKEALTNWWNQLSFEWQGIFRRQLNLQDSVELEDIKDITAITELNLSNNHYIQTIDPLSALVGLRKLNLSNTAIVDLTPIRNLTELAMLDISNTGIADLLPLKYATKLSHLDISRSAVTDISVFENMTALEHVILDDTRVMDFSPLKNLVQLNTLDAASTSLSDISFSTQLTNLSKADFSQTYVNDLSSLAGLRNLKELDIDSTSVRDLSSLATVDSLEVLRANYTLISDLQPLSKLPRLQLIYCDRTNINREKADAFMTKRPGVLVIFDSKDLEAWWKTIDEAWRQVLITTAGINSTPSKEELVVIANLDSIDIGGNTLIHDLKPIARMTRLKVLRAQNSSISDLSLLKHHAEITYLDISGTAVTDIGIVSAFQKLKTLRADRTRIESIEPVYELSSLAKLYVDETYVHDIIARELLEKNPRCLVVYKTNHLNRWWENITGHWIKVFHTQMPDTTATRENLHLLVEQERLEFHDIPVRDLSALEEFVRLRALSFSGTNIHGISSVENIRSLQTLHATNSPVQNIDALARYDTLSDLDLSNTPVEDLEALENLRNLVKLNIAGTQVRKLNAIERLDRLEYLDCSNTGVKSLEPVMRLGLKTLKCYNTRISKRQVEKFRERNPECVVTFY